VAKGLALGAKNAETLVISSAGRIVKGTTQALAVQFLTGSASQTVFVVSPVTGTATSCYATQYVAGNTNTYTVAIGSAGSNVATATLTSLSIGLASAVALSTGGTTITQGSVYRFVRGDQGTAGVSTLTLFVDVTAQ
jgi:hypothetical protein